MYKGLFDENHKILVSKVNPLKKEKLQSDGAYEKDILCFECDHDIIGKHEDYASRAIYGGKVNNAVQPQFEKMKDPQGLKILRVKQLDYRKFKLFLLSVLWRSSISKQGLFKNISLGKHEEILRRIILSGDAGEDSNYECSIIINRESEEVLTKMIMEPRRVRQNGNSYYIMLINTIYYMVNISGFNKMDLIVKTHLKKDNTIDIPILEGNLLTSLYDSVIGVKLRINKKLE